MYYAEFMSEKQIKSFWQKVDPRPTETGCIEWTGSRNLEGRGQAYLSDGSRHAAPRIAWGLAHPDEDLSDDIFVCHHCDNPSCVRIDHLFLGTQKDNMRDAAAKGRMPYGARNHEAKLTDMGVTLARHAHVNGLMGTVEIAKKLGVSHPTMSAALSGKTWKHLPMPVASKERQDD